MSDKTREVVQALVDALAIACDYAKTEDPEYPFHDGDSALALAKSTLNIEPSKP